MGQFENLNIMRNNNQNGIVNFKINVFPLTIFIVLCRLLHSFLLANDKYFLREGSVFLRRSRKKTDHLSQPISSLRASRSNPFKILNPYFI